MEIMMDEEVGEKKIKMQIELSFKYFINLNIFN